MATRGRVLRVDLGALERGERPRPAPVEPGGPLATIAGFGGSALGLVCLMEEHRREQRRDSGGPGPLVLAVGEAVREGLPTAARAAVMAQAPLTGRFAEGHVGGTLGARLSEIADALVLTGRTARPGAVLVLAQDGTTELLARPDLRGLDPAATARTLEAELGPAATLCIGPAGERGLPFASLASGHAPPSFVGRGGLGAVFGALGLKALCVRAGVAAGQRSREASELQRRLASSPRLAARAQGGTLELFDALAARDPEGQRLGHGLAREAEERAAGRHGCRGCPTPCGWVFERADGSRQGARFGASQALGRALGLETLDDALFLLAQCDRLGVDAKEVGTILELLCLAEERGRLAGPALRGDRAALARRIEDLVDDACPDERAPGRGGAALLARELGLERGWLESRARTLRPEADLAALLGQCVASGGADPMRTFPFLLESSTPASLARRLAPLPLPRGALDPREAAGKGRLVFWHENLVAAVDMTGFCAFSAAGLLADGLVELDELAQWILPAALRAPSSAQWSAFAPGQRLLAAGANVVELRRELNRSFGASVEAELPSAARAALARPGMLDEYRILRGLEPDGRPRAETQALLGTPALLDAGHARLPALAEPPPPAPRGRGRTGEVTLQSAGVLARWLGERRALELALPASVTEVLTRAAEEDPDLRRWLFTGAELLPAVWRGGKRLAADDLVEPDDVLDLVLAISGG